MWGCEFLRNGLLLGAAGLIPGVGIAASELFPIIIDVSEEIALNPEVIKWVPEERARKLMQKATDNEDWYTVLQWLKHHPTLGGRNGP